MRFEDFSVVDFPPRPNELPGAPDGFVYVFCWTTAEEEIPFYVGQTNRLSARMNDYRLANFTACTDFCVGEASKYLKSKNYGIKVRYRPNVEPPKEEKSIIRELLVSGVWLVNCLPRYNYLFNSETEERIVVQRFCDMFTANRAIINPNHRKPGDVPPKSSPAEM